LEEIVDVTVYQVFRGNTFVRGPLDYLVVNVGEVLDVAYLVTLVLKVTSQDVEDDVAKGVADVGGGIGGNSADVHFDCLPVG
jgi:3D (Asp-Asp-Asp) domain-containing protein